MKRKYIKKANAWLVSWQEQKDRKVIDKRVWFVSEELADNFIKDKKDETKREDN